MDTNAKPLSRGRRIALGINGALWVMISVSLSWLPWLPFDLEAWLIRHFPPGHADQYEFVNRLVKPPISLGLVAWLGVSIGFIIARRYKLFLINAAGPVVSTLMVAPTEDWSDPQWFTIGAFIAIGCCVGPFVSIFAWIGRSLGSCSQTHSSHSPNDSGTILPQP